MISGLSVIGAGGHAKVVLSTILAAGEEVKGLYDDDPDKQGTEVLGVPVVGALDAVPAGARAVLGIGNEAARQRLAEALSLAWRTVVHPSAVVDPSVVIGVGAVVFAGAVIQPEARIGAHAVVNTGATVDHDCVIDDFAQVGPGAHLSGGVRIGEGAFLGTGTIVVPGVSIGAWSVIGAGAVVTTDIPDGVVAMGVPARPVRPISEVRA